MYGSARVRVVYGVRLPVPGVRCLVVPDHVSGDLAACGDLTTVLIRPLPDAAVACGVRGRRGRRRRCGGRPPCSGRGVLRQLPGSTQVRLEFLVQDRRVQLGQIQNVVGATVAELHGPDLVRSKFFLVNVVNKGDHCSSSHSCHHTTAHLQHPSVPARAGLCPSVPVCAGISRRSTPQRRRPRPRLSRSWAHVRVPRLRRHLV